MRCHYWKRYAMLDHSQQLKKLKTWPIEQEATDKLKIVGSQRLPELLRMPALIVLLLWAVEDTNEMKGNAQTVSDELVSLSMTNPMQVIRILVDLDGEERTSTRPMLADAITSQDIAQAILEMANATTRQSV